MDNRLKPEKKRLFIILLSIVGSTLVVLTGLFWYISYKGLDSISKFAGNIFTLLILAFGFFLLFSVLVLVFTMISGKQSKIASKLRGPLNKLLFPLVIKVSKLFHLDKDRITRSFIAINNELVMEYLNKKTIKDLLVLLPHCIQMEDCELKVTKDILICRKCGRCNIGGLAKIAEKYNLTMNVATGGTIARRLIKEKLPDVILAVACERDLLSGVLDTYPLPVLGVFNSRPNGPCINTVVDVDLIEEIIKLLNISPAGVRGT